MAESVCLSLTFHNVTEFLLIFTMRNAVTSSGYNEVTAAGQTEFYQTLVQKKRAADNASSKQYDQPLASSASS